MSKIFTNCSSCTFHKNDLCLLNKWSSKGFNKLKTIVDNQGVRETHIDGRICTFHRTKYWADHFNKLQIDLKQQVWDENQLKYALVTCIDDENDPEIMLNQIEHVVKSKHRPLKIYLVNNCSNPKYTNEYLKNSFQFLNVPFKIKKTLIKQPNEKFIDEFAMTDRLTEHFYLGLLKPGFSTAFLDSLHSLIYHDMLQIMYAGDSDSYYYMPTALHKLCSSGFKEYVEQESGIDCTRTYNEVLGL